jgi:hypothetical protein
MRAIRSVAVAALVALNVSAAAAQPTRHFKDSWFWGLKAGALRYQVLSDPDPDNPIEKALGGPVAPLGGIDWMITRTNGGLYVSYDRSIFDQFIFLNDSVGPTEFTPAPGFTDQAGGRVVSLRDMNRFTIAGVLFPMQTYFLHPYIGLGATMNHIAKTVPEGTYSSPTQRALVEATVAELRSVASPVFMLGFQMRLPLASAFGQVTVSPVSDRFFLFTGGGYRATFEGGLRYNVGSSIERMR